MPQAKRGRPEVWFSPQSVAAGGSAIVSIMVAFDPEADLSRDRALRLLTNTSVTLFWRARVLDETTAWLSDHGYQVVRVDAAHWTTEHDLHRGIAAALSFPDYYGRNLNALNDCMRDVVRHRYGWATSTTGLVLVFTSYDAFAKRCPGPAQAVLAAPGARTSPPGTRARTRWYRFIDIHQSESALSPDTDPGIQRRQCHRSVSEM